MACAVIFGPQFRRMKIFPRLSALSLALALTASVSAQIVKVPLDSPKASVSQTIGITNVEVVYYRPSVNRREIWGKLVPFGYNDLGFGTSKSAPWRAGANENTTISFEHPVAVAGKLLPAGRYGLSMAVAESGTVTVIFSRDSEAWGSFFYEPSADALRVDVKWEDAPFREQLTYDFSAVTDRSAVLALSWEKKRIPIPLTVDTDGIVVAHLKNELRNAPGFYYQAWVEASKYLVNHNLDLQLALQWAEKAISDPNSGERNFTTLSNQAVVLTKLGREDDVKTVMNEAMKLGTVAQVHQYGRQLIAAGKGARALEVFKRNAELHPDVWPVNYGLARGYSAVGDYPAALAAIEKAQAQVPAGDAANANAIKINIAKLKRGQDIN